MSESAKQKRQAEIAKIYHRKLDLKTAAGVEIGPSGDEIISGVDDRKDFFQLADSDAAQALQKKLILSTVILTDRTDLTRQVDGSFKLNVDPFRRGEFPPCGGERFGNQHTGGWCSGFMVGKDVIATAGHCGETNAKIQETAYVFGFRVADANDPGTTEFTADQVYFGKELIAHDLSSTGDFAIVRLDREIASPGAVALRIRDQGSIGVGSNVGVIGYPSGLPVKVAFGDATVVMRDDDPWLIANLDTYGGNSGSAVFGSDGLVEGILVRGARDYNIDPAQGCFVSNRIVDAAGSEAVTKASVFVQHVPKDPT